MRVYPVYPVSGEIVERDGDVGLSVDVGEHRFDMGQPALEEHVLRVGAT